MSEYLPYIISVFVGIGLSAATGFRIFMPFFILSLGSYLNWIPVNDSYIWLSTVPAVISTGIAMILEILAYYIPFVDNVLDSISVPLATIAGVLLFASQFTEVNNWLQWSLAIIAGGGTAATISSVMAGTRAASSGTTAGLGNPVISTFEAIISGIMSFLAIFLPVIAIILVLILLYLCIKYGRKILTKIRGNKNSEYT